jgi:hypothetical protein
MSDDDIRAAIEPKPTGKKHRRNPQILKAITPATTNPSEGTEAVQASPESPASKPERAETVVPQDPTPEAA